MSRSESCHRGLPEGGDDPLCTICRTAERGYYVELGRRGGNATKAKYGRGHYVKQGTAGGKRMRELIKRGRDAEEREQR